MNFHLLQRAMQNCAILLLLVGVLGTNALVASDDSLQLPTPTVMPDQNGFQQADLSIVTGNIQRPNGMLWHQDMLYMSCTGDWTLYRIDPETGDTIAYIYGVKNANSLYAEGSDAEVTLWIPDFQANTLVTISGGQMQVIGQVESPWGIALFDDTRFAITSTRNNSLVFVTRDGEITDRITNLRSPTGVAIHESAIYVANSGSARRAVEWFEPEAVDLMTTSLEADQVGRSLVSGVQNVTNLVIGQDGMLYLSYALGTRGVVGRVDPGICRNKDGCTSRDVEIVLYTELAAPLAGLTFTDEMQMFVHTVYSPDIYSVQLSN
jgi:sugar lactone lactonase YvrE